MDIPTFLRKLNNGISNYKYVHTNGNNKVLMFTRLRVNHFTPLVESNRWSIFKVSHPFYDDFLLCYSHLPSKVNWSSESQSIECSIFRNAIEEIRTTKKIDRIIITGDFNMNPFEPGLISTNTFHATQDLNIARKKSRIVQGKQFNYFYNPMWNFFGDKSVGDVPGTFLHKSSEHTTHDWNLFDQVLLSPDIADYVPVESIKIITKSNLLNLLKPNGEINHKYSDHLPISFNLIQNKIK